VGASQLQVPYSAANDQIRCLTDLPASRCCSAM
jgi:hypothetical protein